MSIKVRYSSELYHYGIKGQKWGVRRYQNPDGTLTPLGKERYGDEPTDRKAKRKLTRKIKEDAGQEFNEDQLTGDNLQLKAAYAGGYKDRMNKIHSKNQRVYDKELAKSVKSGKKLSRKGQKAEMRLRASKQLNDKINETYPKWDEATEKHYNKMIEKYGKEAIKGGIDRNKKTGSIRAGDAEARNTTTIVIPFGNGGYYIYYEMPVYRYDSGKAEATADFRREYKKIKREGRK